MVAFGRWSSRVEATDLGALSESAGDGSAGGDLDFAEAT